MSTNYCVCVCLLFLCDCRVLSTLQYQLSHRLGKAALQLHASVIPCLQKLFLDKPQAQEEYLRSRIEVSIKIRTGLPVASYLKLVQLLGQHLLTREGFYNTCLQLGFAPTYKFISVQQWLIILASVDTYAKVNTHLYKLAEQGHAIEDQKQAFSQAHLQWRTLLNFIGFSNFNIQEAIKQEHKILLQAWNKDFLNSNISAEVWTKRWVIRFAQSSMLKLAQELLNQVYWSYNTYNKVYTIKGPKYQILFSGQSASYVFLQALLEWGGKKEIKDLYLTAAKGQPKPNIVLERIE